MNTWYFCKDYMISFNIPLTWIDVWHKIICSNLAKLFFNWYFLKFENHWVIITNLQHKMYFAYLFVNCWKPPNFIFIYMTNKSWTLVISTLIDQHFYSWNHKYVFFIFNTNTGELHLSSFHVRIMVDQYIDMCLYR